MSDKEEDIINPEDGLWAAGPSPITGIGFRPTKISKGGFVTEIESYREDR